MEGLRRAGGQDKQAGKQQRRQHDAGFHWTELLNRNLGIHLLLALQPAKCLWRIVVRKFRQGCAAIVDASPVGKASLLVIVDPS
jgi:hypothetical protein